MGNSKLGMLVSSGACPNQVEHTMHELLDRITTVFESYGTNLIFLTVTTGSLVVDVLMIAVKQRRGKAHFNPEDPTVVASHHLPERNIHLCSSVRFQCGTAGRWKSHSSYVNPSPPVPRD